MSTPFKYFKSGKNTSLNLDTSLKCLCPVPTKSETNLDSLFLNFDCPRCISRPCDQVLNPGNVSKIED